MVPTKTKRKHIQEQPKKRIRAQGKGAGKLSIYKMGYYPLTTLLFEPLLTLGVSTWLSSLLTRVRNSFTKVIHRRKYRRSYVSIGMQLLHPPPLTRNSSFTNSENSFPTLTSALNLLLLSHYEKLLSRLSEQPGLFMSFIGERRRQRGDTN
jgi:hypothetical protein